MQMQYPTLTKNQKLVLETIINYVRTNNIPPTTRELQKLSGLSPRGITLQLDILEEQDLITRKPGARGILVNPALLHTAEETISVNLIKSLVEEESIVNIPLMTSPISAGYGNDVEDYIEDQISVSLSNTRGLRNVFAVKVSGDSMIGAGIENGDIAIIAAQPIANDGDIVAAHYENGVTLKKFKIVEGRALLIPANPNYEPITNHFSIQGKLINIIKNTKG
jgi:repressor LexA